jgi:hypothetical protein
MSPLISRYATPLTTGLFAVSTISGVALFFHWGSATFHEMHEWLSMLLLAPFAFHLVRNWTAFKNYFRKAPMAIALVASLLLAIPFALPSGDGERGGRGAAMFQLMPMVTQASLADLAPVLKATPDDLAARLRAKGYAVTSTAQSLEQIAKASHAEAPALLATVLPARAEAH